MDMMEAAEMGKREKERKETGYWSGKEEGENEDGRKERREKEEDEGMEGGS